MIFKKPLIYILTLGVLIRLFLSAFTFHSDIAHFDLAGYVLGKGNLLNFYDYRVDLFNYPPAVYFSIGTLDWLLTNFTDGNFHNDFLFNFQNTLGDERLYLHLILLKTPYFLFDLLAAYLLFNLFTLRREKIMALTLWIFNPWLLYSTYMIGQFDIIPTSFVILALYVVAKKTDLQRGVVLASVILGIGASFKIYPLLLLPPLVFLLNSWSKRILVATLGVSVYLATVMPFIGSSGFRSTALVANQTLKSLYAQIPISGGESIILFLAVVGFFYLIFLYRPIEASNLWQRFFIILLLFFSLTHYHPQWFLWLTPFLIIELIRSDFKHLFPIIIMAISFVGLVFLFEQSLSLGLFSPLNPILYNGPSFWQLLNITIDVNFLRSLFQSLFVFAAGYFIFYYFPKKSN